MDSMADTLTRAGMFFEDLTVGMEATHEHRVTDADIQAFSALSGDRNPVHLDSAYAAGTIFKDRIAHGIMTASYISTIFGMKLPGPGAIYVSQTLNFKGPVKIGDLVEARVTLQELIPGKRRALFSCECKVREKTVLAGDAILMVPGRAA